MSNSSPLSTTKPKYFNQWENTVQLPNTENESYFLKWHWMLFQTLVFQEFPSWLSTFEYYKILTEEKKFWIHAPNSDRSWEKPKYSHPKERIHLIWRHFNSTTAQYANFTQKTWKNVLTLWMCAVSDLCVNNLWIDFSSSICFVGNDVIDWLPLAPPPTPMRILTII